LKAIIYKSKENKAELVQIKKPEIGNGEALVKVKYVGICGADINLIRGEREITEDVIPGHEIIGVVVEVKNGGENLIGKRVAVEPTISCGSCQMCRLGLPHICYNLKVLGVHAPGGMAEYIKVPLKKIHLLPDEITDEKAIIIEPLAVAVHVVNRSGLAIGEKVIVVGFGPVGMLIAQVCRAKSAGKIKIMEINPFRQNLCRYLGFDLLEPNGKISKNEKTNGFLGFDIGYEVSGSDEGMKQIFNNIRSQGKIVVVGLFKKSYPIEFSQVLFRELEVIGSRVYESKDFKTGLELILKDKIDVKSVVTNILELEDFDQGFKLASDKNAMKVILKVY
jgi:(R,R)-butanediol dehydrogenase / meso-butanediol dehydrogenase / diacetyl reductase